ncbi:MAG: thiamine pyrophosphate-dependent enzyme [Syntrophobacteraceae bacterium]|nr:thiamine pyrophosphate-dependent enzyme [Syntrophobacteraceae bacterium]
MSGQTALLDSPEQEYILPGNRLCAGCGVTIAYRFILKALGKKTVVCVPASCLTILHGIYPKTPVMATTVNNTFAGTGAAASGISAALKATGREDWHVLAMAGDGGTFDMGIQSLSGAAERGENIIYVCYDNEAYMNTGSQRSSATPVGAVTTTTPINPKEQPKKDFMKIMEAHSLPYMAAVSSSYPGDVYNKFLKAREIKGTRFFHLSAPCPTGWWYPTKDTVKIGKMMVEACIFPLYEVEEDRVSLTGKSLSIARSGGKKPIDDYIAMQGRFKKILPEQVREFQRLVDKRWEALLARAGY